MQQYYDIPVKKINRETPDAVSIELDIPDQFAEMFDYKPGQHLAFKHTVNGEELRRNYSLCSIPEEGWKIAVKRIPEGRFSSFANKDLTEGDLLHIMPPTGHFTLPFDSKNQKIYVAFAAGSGITPIISLLKEGLSQEPASEFILIYGNKRQESILFRDEISDLKNEFVGRLSVFHVLSEEKLGSPLQEGRIDKEKCKVFTKYIFDQKTVDHFLLCGPEEMIFNVKEQLVESGVDSAKIKFELFTTDGLKNRMRSNGKGEHEVHKKVISTVEIRMDGNSYSFDLESDKMNVLDAAVKAGADLPFSCKGGVCSTCKAKLLQGEVEMDVNYALEPDELEAGFILTCQSHPKSERLVIDFDQ